QRLPGRMVEFWMLEVTFDALMLVGTEPFERNVSSRRSASTLGVIPGRLVVTNGAGGFFGGAREPTPVVSSVFQANLFPAPPGSRSARPIQLGLRSAEVAVFRAPHTRAERGDKGRIRLGADVDHSYHIT